MSRICLVAVGACAVDTILTVPHLPEEDSKLRATCLSKRRGGNSANTLEVLQQLLEADRDLAADSPPPELYLITPLPNKDAPVISFIQDSFRSSSGQSQKQNVKVDLSKCLYRFEHTEPISSYIINSSATSSRTVINHQPLPEMTFEEFVERADRFLASYAEGDMLWFHFEGRIPAVTLLCIRYLREWQLSGWQPLNSQNHRRRSLRISVEVEKPGRKGLEDLARGADVVFYSRSWAAAGGLYIDADACLKDQAGKIASGQVNARSMRWMLEKLLVCTWGEGGACAVSISQNNPDEHDDGEAEDDGVPAKRTWSTKDIISDVVRSPAFVDQERLIVDSTGAGDTFIAGMLFAFVCRDGIAEGGKPTWSLRQRLDFANGLAGRKILQDGFGKLAERVEDLKRGLDS